MIKIHKFLKLLTKEEWNYLRLGISYAEHIWHIQKQFTLSDEEMVKKLGISKSKLKNMQIGAFNFTIKDLAKLECLAKEEIQDSYIVTINLDKKNKSTYGF